MSIRIVDLDRTVQQNDAMLAKLATQTELLRYVAEIPGPYQVARPPHRTAVRVDASVSVPAMTDAGQAVRARQEHLGLSMVALAEAAGISRDTLSEIEHGQGFRRSSLTKIERVLNDAEEEAGFIASLPTVAPDEPHIVALTPGGPRQGRLCQSHSREQPTRNAPAATIHSATVTGRHRLARMSGYRSLLVADLFAQAQ
jgi:transcriptional regulator with XRE-family HTH domain